MLWRPALPDLTSSHGAGLAPTKTRLKQSSGTSKGKEREKILEGLERTIWIWAHPSVFDQAFVELRTAASFALEAAKQAGIPSDKAYEVQIANLREQVNVFEIMGPKSSQVIKGALKPVLEDARDELKNACNSFEDLHCLLTYHSFGTVSTAYKQQHPFSEIL